MRSSRASEAHEGRISNPPAVILVPIFVVLAFAMTFRDFDRFGTHIVGDTADGLLVLWILGWVQHAIPHGWDAIWDANNFFPAQNTLAYAESMLPVAVVNWPLRALFGDAAGLNVLFVAAEAACLWFTYRLALRLTGSWPASVIGALAFSFSSVRLSQLGHTQLTLAAFLIPLTFLLLIEYFDRPRILVAAGIGAALGVTATSTAYYGVMMAVAVPVFVVGYLVWFRRDGIRRFIPGLVVAALLAAAIGLPVALRYSQLQQDPHFVTGYVPEFAATAEDFLAPPRKSYLLADLPVFNTAERQNFERRLFPGIVALGFGVVGAVVVVREATRHRRRESASPREEGAPPAGGPPRPARLTLLLVASGLVCLVLAFGDELAIGGRTIALPYHYLRSVPGFEGVRVLSRFVLVAQCALAVLAAFGVRTVLQRLHRNVALVVAVMLAAFVIAETAVKVPMTRVPTGTEATAVGEELAERPPGVVVELPMLGPEQPQEWPSLESPRQLVSLLDDNPRVNGYSGQVPEGFGDVVRALNTFPSREALQVADEHDVRYVVLRTDVIGAQRGYRDVLDEDGVGRYRPATAERLIDRIPPPRLEDVTELPGGFLVELRPPRRGHRRSASRRAKNSR